LYEEVDYDPIKKYLRWVAVKLTARYATQIKYCTFSKKVVNTDVLRQTNTIRYRNSPGGLEVLAKAALETISVYYLKLHPSKAFPKFDVDERMLFHIILKYANTRVYDIQTHPEVLSWNSKSVFREPGLLVNGIQYIMKHTSPSNLFGANPKSYGYRLADDVELPKMNGINPSETLDPSFLISHFHLKKSDQYLVVPDPDEFGSSSDDDEDDFLSLPGTPHSSRYSPRALSMLSPRLTSPRLDQIKKKKVKTSPKKKSSSLGDVMRRQKPSRSSVFTRYTADIHTSHHVGSPGNYMHKRITAREKQRIPKRTKKDQEKSARRRKSGSYTLEANTTYSSQSFHDIFYQDYKPRRHLSNIYTFRV